MPNIISVCVVSSLLSTLNLTSIRSFSSISQQYDEVCSMLPEWLNSSCSLKYEKNDFQLYYVYDENSTFTGYFTSYKNEITSFFNGNSEPELSSLIIKYNSNEMNNTIKDSLDTSIDYFETTSLSSDSNLSMIDVPSNLYTAHYDSFSSLQYLLNCPFYYNASYGPIENGCTPIAIVTLISFYDRYTGDFMITHYDWYGERTGDYYVTEDYFLNCVYMRG